MVASMAGALLPVEPTEPVPAKALIVYPNCKVAGEKDGDIVGTGDGSTVGTTVGFEGMTLG